MTISDINHSINDTDTMLYTVTSGSTYSFFLISLAIFWISRFSNYETEVGYHTECRVANPYVPLTFVEMFEPSALTLILIVFWQAK